MKQTDLKHNWIIDSATLFEKCSHCGVFKRERPKWIRGRLSSTLKEVQYSPDGKKNWGKGKPKCLPVIKTQNGKTRKDKSSKIQ